MIYVFVCARVRDSAWGVERGGGGEGGNWSQRAAFHMNGGGGGGRPPPLKPMLDPGLVINGNFNKVASAIQLQFPTFQIFPFELWLGSQKHSCCLGALIQTQIDTDQFVIYHMQTYEKIHDDLETM